MSAHDRDKKTYPHVEWIRGHKVGYADGLQAARDAVAAAPWDAENWIAHAQRAADLAAIDTLRGES